MVSERTNGQTAQAHSNRVAFGTAGTFWSSSTVRHGTLKKGNDTLVRLSSRFSCKLAKHVREGGGGMPLVYNVINHQTENRMAIFKKKSHHLVVPTSRPYADRRLSYTTFLID